MNTASAEEQAADARPAGQEPAAGESAEAPPKVEQNGNAADLPEDSLGDLLPPDGRKSIVSGQVRSQAAFIGGSIHSVTISSGDRSFPVPLADLTALHARAAFVEPPGYQDLVRSLTRQRVVVCHGKSGCGKELAVTRALQEVKASVIRLIPAGLELAETSRVIAAETEDGAACVLSCLSDSWLSSLAGTTGQPILAAASGGHVMVVVLSAHEPARAVARHFEVVALDYPDDWAVLAACAAAAGVPANARELAGSVLDRLDPPVGPATVTQVLAEAVAGQDRTAAEIASLFSNTLTAEAVTSWLGDGRRAREISVVAAGATLSGAPAIVVQEAADDLRALLEPAEPADRLPELIDGGGSWPGGLLRPATVMTNTHFGRERAEVVEVAAPHRPESIIRAVWLALGPAFRGRYCDWLAELAGAPGLKWHAAFTAGVLFSVDPALIEARVLRPWLDSDLRPLIRCAGLALGAPVAVGDDPSAARRLAHFWATSGQQPARLAAIAAYGGLLGAWDVSSAAPLKLFALCQVSPELRGEAQAALARLVVAGADAVSARTAVISYLNLSIADRAARALVYDCLPAVAGALVRPDAICAGSLAALREETGNWLGLAGLIAMALTEPGRSDHGPHCLGLFVQASASGEHDQDLVEDLIRGMRGTCRSPQGEERLGLAIKRALAGFTRSDDEQVSARARALLRSFFR